MANLLIYAFTGSTLNPTTTASGLTGSAATNGSLTSIDQFNDGWASDPELVACPPASTTTAALAVTNNSYWYFTATPNSGEKISLATLTLKAGRGGSSTPRGLKIRSSIDSYAADLYSHTIDTAIPTWSAISIDLSGAGFQNLTAAITFRFYVWCPTNSNSLDSDDITLTGAVADAAVAVPPNFLPFFWA